MFFCLPLEILLMEVFSVQFECWNVDRNASQLRVVFNECYNVNPFLGRSIDLDMEI